MAQNVLKKILKENKEKNVKKALVLGAGGFIGSHMVKRLKQENYWIRGVDLKYPEFSPSKADDFVIQDLREYNGVEKIMTINGEVFDEIYQFAADMGGAGYIFTGQNDAHIMHNSSTINLNVCDIQQKLNEKHNINKTTIFYSSSACMYPAYNQEDPDNPLCSEKSAYPAEPDSEYGWEKLFSERLYLAFQKNYGIPVRIGRFHNIFGPEGTWEGGKEKSPAALCRKVAMSKDGTIEIWGDGKQTRSFLYIDECIEAVYRMMKSDFSGPVNIGSEEMVTINRLVDIICSVSGKQVEKIHIDGPLGVRGRNSDNTLIREKLNWDYKQSLEEGISKLYPWIVEKVKEKYEA